MKRPLHHSYSAIGTAFKNNYRFFFLSLFIACLCCPAYEMFYAAGIDGPLPWIYNYFAHGNYLKGRDITLPHGPLAFLLYPLPVANNFHIALAFHLFCAALLGWSLFKIAGFTGNIQYPLISAILLLLLSLADIQLILIGIVSCFVLLYRMSGGKIFSTASVFFAALALFIKTYCGIICCLIVASEIFHQLFIRKKPLVALRFVLLALLFFFTGWLALYHSFTGSLRFLYGQYQLSSANSEAVHFAHHNSWWLLGTAIGSFLALHFVLKGRHGRSFFLTMLLPVFAAWKYAMARNEEFHMITLFNFILLFTLILWIIGEERKLTHVVLLLLSLASLMLNISQHENFSKHKDVQLFKVHNLYRATIGYDSLASERNAASAYYMKWQQLPDTLKKVIGKSTCDVYPWNYAIIAANGLNWQPRPVIHSYAGYTHWLDGRNSAFIQSPRSAQFMIWEITDPDEKGYGLESIDYRYILNDEPQTVINFFSLYDLRMKEGRYLLYEKRATPCQLKITESGNFSAHLNAWIEVPETTGDVITRAKVSLTKTFRGKLKSLLYKGEVFNIFYELDNGKILCHRIVPDNARDGLWLNPMILHPEADNGEARVKKIKIACTNPLMVKHDFSLGFEQIEIINKGRPVNIAMHCFKKDGRYSAPVFFGLDKAETLTLPSHFIPNDYVKKTGEQFLSAPSSYILQPGQHSGIMGVEPDTLRISKNAKSFRFNYECFVKTGMPTNAILVVGTDTAVRNGHWRHIKPVKENLVAEGQWSHVFYSETVPATNENLFKRYFYIWNRDSKYPLFLDDMSVIVEEVK
jgi:hypothetical protein